MDRDRDVPRDVLRELGRFNENDFASPRVGLRPLPKKGVLLLLLDGRLSSSLDGERRLLSRGEGFLDRSSRGDRLLLSEVERLRSREDLCRSPDRCRGLRSCLGSAIFFR